HYDDTTAKMLEYFAVVEPELGGSGDESTDERTGVFASAVRHNFNQHLADDPSRPAALLLGYIRQVCALVAPCRTDASSAN
ncbi:MAG TPA: hypothetical protein VF524_11140, partial [Polyangia bacterium]